jgi:hypothetical protein
MTAMNDNLIAICLYIGILLMAGTVLVLTIVYFVRPNTAQKPQLVGADIKPVTEDAKPAHKKIHFKFPVIKMKLKKPEIATAVQKRPKKKSKDVVVNAVETNKLENKANESVTVIVPGKSENEEKQVAAILESKKPENNEKPVMPVVEAKRTEFKEAAAVKPSVAESRENKDIQPEVKLEVKTEKELKTNVLSQPITVNSEKQEPPIPQETPKPVIIEAAPVPLPPSAEVAKPAPDTVSHSTSEKEKPTAVEAIKKESETEMDVKNVKSTAGTASETPSTPPVTVKITTTTTATASSAAQKKGPEQKTSLDDFSQMFAKEMVDDSEATKLAKDMKEVEIDSLVKDGQDLVALLKRGRS